MGLVPTWFDGANPTTGLGVAHDMLEHFKSDPGPTEGECQALGSFLLIRAEPAHFNRNNSRSPLAGDLLGILYDIVEQSRQMPKSRKTRPLDEFSEKLLQSGLREAFADIEGMLEEIEDEEERSETRTRMLSSREDIASWIRVGYRKALRRYSNCDTYSVGRDLFKKIEKLVDELLGSELLWPNAKVRVSACPRTFQAWARVFNPDTGTWLDHQEFI